MTFHLHPDPFLLVKYSVFLAQKNILTRLRFSHSSGSMQNVLASGVDPQHAFSLTTVECACSAEKVYCFHAGYADHNTNVRQFNAKYMQLLLRA